MNVVHALFVALAEYSHWRRVALELKTRRAVIDAVKDSHKEIDELEKQIKKQRRIGNHSIADRLLEQQAHTSSFREWVSNLEERAELQGSKGLRAGRRSNDNKEEPTNP